MICERSHCEALHRRLCTRRIFKNYDLISLPAFLIGSSLLILSCVYFLIPHNLLFFSVALSGFFFSLRLPFLTCSPPSPPLKAICYCVHSQLGSLIGFKARTKTRVVKKTDRVSVLGLQRQTIPQTLEMSQGNSWESRDGVRTKTVKFQDRKVY